MNNVVSFVLILVCVVIGYVLEPTFFPMDGGGKPVAEKSEEVVVDPAQNEETAEETSQPVVSGESQKPVDLTRFTKANFPELVTLKVPHKFVDAESGVTMNLKSGVKVKPLRFEAGLLVIQPVGYPIEGKIEVDHTDFIALAESKMKARVNADSENEGVREGVVENEKSSEDVPVVEAEEDTPEAVVGTFDDPDDDVIEDLPENTAETNGSSTVGDDAIVKIIKASVAAKEVKEFDASQVVAWKVGKPFTLNGKTYQTGVVTFKAETLLGVQENDALALIENGAVVKWLWAKTKLKMR